MDVSATAHASSGTNAAQEGPAFAGCGGGSVPSSEAVVPQGVQGADRLGGGSEWDKLDWNGFKFSIDVDGATGAISLRSSALPKAIMRRSEFLRGLRSAAGSTAIPVHLPLFVRWLEFDSERLDGTSSLATKELMDLLQVAHFLVDHDMTAAVSELLASRLEQALVDRDEPSSELAAILKMLIEHSPQLATLVLEASRCSLLHLLVVLPSALHTAAATSRCVLRTELRAAGQAQADRDVACHAMQRLGPALPALRHLTLLDLSDNEMGAEAARALAPHFHHLAALRDLDLSGNALQEGGASAVAQQLGMLTALCALRAARNQLGAAGALCFSEHLPSVADRLTLLDLGTNKLGGPGAVALAPGLRCLLELKDLDLQNSSFDSPVDVSSGASALLASISLLTKLTALRFAVNRLGLGGGVAACITLACLSSLQLLDFSRTALAPVAMIAVSSTLGKTATGLSRLLLGGIGKADQITAMEDFLEMERSAPHHVAQTVFTSLRDVSLAKAPASARALLTAPRVLSIHTPAAITALDLTGAHDVPGFASVPALADLNLTGASVHTSAFDSARCLTRLVLRNAVLLYDVGVQEGADWGEGGVAAEEEDTLLAHLVSMSMLEVLVVDRVKALRDVGTERLGERLAALGALRTLRLCCLGLGDDGATRVGVSLPSLSRLEELSLAQNRLASVGARAVLQGAACLECLTALDLSGAAIATTGDVETMGPLLSAMTQLRVLVWPGAAAGSRALAWHLAPLGDLKELDLSHCALGEATPVDIGWLGALSALHSLNIKENGLFATGVGPVGAQLAAARRLSALNLSGNALAESGARELAQHLGALTGMRELKMRKNRLTATGVRAILPALARLFLLQRLDLGDNELGTEGGEALAPTLARLVALRMLHLDRNKICSARIKGKGSAVLKRALGPCQHHHCDTRTQ